MSLSEKANYVTESENFLGDDIVEVKTYEEHEFIAEYADEFNPTGLAIALKSDKFKYRVVKTRPTLAAMLILLCELAERGSYYGTQGVLTNFIMRPLPEGSTTGRVLPGHIGNAGALGMGLVDANALTTLLQFLAYVMPLVGGYLADDSWGKFKTIIIGVWIGIFSHILFIIAAIPAVIEHPKASLALIIISILSLSVCTGFIKANLLPLMLDQYPYRTNVLKKLPSGEIVYVDRDGSMETLTLIFYWAINIGSFLEIGTSYAARYVGYWLAYLCPGILYALCVVAMIFVKPQLKHEVPQGSLLKKLLQVLRVCFKGNFISRLRNGEFWSYAFPSNMESRGIVAVNSKSNEPIPWTDQDVRDFKSTLTQCIMFSYWVIFNFNDGGIGSTLNAQAGAMTTNGVPNDLFNNFNQIAIVIAIPILDYFLYPLLMKYGINFKAVHKIFVGFMLGALSSVVAAVLQQKIYETSPCGYYASTCAEPAPITAWYEVINYGLSAVGECFCYTTAYELAYTRAPDNAKGLVMALFLFNQAIASAISEALSDVLNDPNLTWVFVACAAAGGFFAFLFLIVYWNLDKIMDKEALEREQTREKLLSGTEEYQLKSVVSAMSK